MLRWRSLQIRKLSVNNRNPKEASSRRWLYMFDEGAVGKCLYFPAFNTDRNPSCIAFNEDLRYLKFLLVCRRNGYCVSEYFVTLKWRTWALKCQTSAIKRTTMADASIFSISLSLSPERPLCLSYKDGHLLCSVCPACKGLMFSLVMWWNVNAWLWKNIC